MEHKVDAQLTNIALANLRLPSDVDCGEAALDRLEESIRLRGILTPLLVRPMNGSASTGFEIVDGLRRFEVARRLGITKVPCIVRRDMTDADVVEVKRWAQATKMPRRTR